MCSVYLGTIDRGRSLTLDHSVSHFVCVGVTLESSDVRERKDVRILGPGTGSGETTNAVFGGALFFGCVPFFGSW